MLLFVKGNKKAGNSNYGISYDGEKQMGDLNNWRLLTSDANDLLMGSYDLLSTRSTTLYHTYPPARSAIKKQTIYGIGPGLTFKSQPDFSTIGWTKQRAVAWGKEFQKIVHYYFQEMNFYEKQGVLYNSSMYSGDSLLFFERINGRLSDLIEVSGDQIDSRYCKEDYTLGIRKDQLLRRKGIIKRDGTKIDFTDSNGDQNVIQFYFKEIARQLRGYPLAYSIINLARNDDTHTDAITHRAVMESIIFGTFKGNGTNLNKQAQDLAKKNRRSKGQTTSSNFFSRLGSAIKLGAGNIFTFNNSEDFQFTDLKTPSGGFKDFKDYMVKYVGQATETPPEVISSEYSTSFTAHKGALNDFIKSFMKRRRTFERTVMDIVVREIAKDAIQQRLIQAPGFFEGGRFMQRAYLQGMYLGPVPGHINPFVEVKADELAVKNSFALRSDIAETMSGHDFDIMSEEWAQEQNQFTNSPQTFQEKVQAGLEAIDRAEEDENGGGDA